MCIRAIVMYAHARPRPSDMQRRGSHLTCGQASEMISLIAAGDCKVAKSFMITMLSRTGREAHRLRNLMGTFLPTGTHMSQAFLLRLLAAWKVRRALIGRPSVTTITKLVASV